MERSIFGLSTKAKLCGNEEERTTIISCDKTVAREREKLSQLRKEKTQKSCMRMRNRWFVFVCAMIEKKNCALHALKKEKELWIRSKAKAAGRKRKIMLKIRKSNLRGK